ncbi:MAG: hypothetical protein WA063_04610 [Minisyncoccia bacterium]
MSKRDKLEKEIEREKKTLAEMESDCKERIRQKKLEIAGLQYDLRNLKED